MIVERGFPLLRRINYLLAAMRDMGIMSKLFDDFNYNMTILESMREFKEHIAAMTAAGEEPVTDVIDEHLESSKKRHDSPEIVLTVEHLEGAFTVHILGLVISATVFLLELFFHSKFVQRFVDYLKEKVCCGSKVKTKAKPQQKTKKKVRFVIPKNKIK